ncbi:MAG: hypothetical protein BWZ10_01136 [candidate division BRC1 bacterium ADurb.BinA364]|nr:MAG: hypothetical protein BWZ10_01136 [candidate division BRC1 bacterium ADurb.BinA364]
MNKDVIQSEKTLMDRVALRYRATRFISVKEAGKPNSETKIHTIHKAKDMRTGGAWAPLYGHIMFEAPILEEKVNK